MQFTITAMREKWYVCHAYNKLNGKRSIGFGITHYNAFLDSVK